MKETTKKALKKMHTDKEGKIILYNIYVCKASVYILTLHGWLMEILYHFTLCWQKLSQHVAKMTQIKY